MILNYEPPLLKRIVADEDKEPFAVDMPPLHSEGSSCAAGSPGPVPKPSLMGCRGRGSNPRLLGPIALQIMSITADSLALNQLSHPGDGRSHTMMSLAIKSCH